MFTLCLLGIMIVTLFLEVPMIVGMLIAALTAQKL